MYCKTCPPSFHLASAHSISLEKHIHKISYTTLALLRLLLLSKCTPHSAAKNIYATYSSTHLYIHGRQPKRNRISPRRHSSVSRFYLSGQPLAVRAPLAILWFHVGFNDGLRDKSAHTKGARIAHKHTNTLKHAHNARTHLKQSYPSGGASSSCMRWIPSCRHCRRCLSICGRLLSRTNIHCSTTRSCCFCTLQLLCDCYYYSVRHPHHPILPSCCLVGTLTMSTKTTTRTSQTVQQQANKDI